MAEFKSPENELMAGRNVDSSRMTKALIRLPEGVRDYLPRAESRRQHIVNTLLGAFNKFGYEQVRTPIFEVADVLERGLGPLTRASTVRFVEPGTGEEVALRPDITPQVARMVATRFSETKGATRLCYQGPVVRSKRGSGGQKEILQVGAELFGASGLSADVEALSLAAEALFGTNVKEKKLEVGHVAFVAWAISQMPNAEAKRSMRDALSRKDMSAVRRLVDGLPSDTAALLEALPRLYGDPKAVFAKLKNLSVPQELQATVAYLKTLIEKLGSEIATDEKDFISVDLGDARGFDYYTGIRIFGYLGGVGMPVLVGGRYDALTESYGRKMPGIGFAVDAEAVATAQGDSTAVEPYVTEGILIAVEGENSSGSLEDLAGNLVRQLRQRGMRAAIFLTSSDAPDAIANANGTSGAIDDSELGAYAARCGYAIVLQVSSKTLSVLGQGDLDANISNAFLAGRSDELLRLIESKNK